MRRLFAIAASVAILILAFAPAVLASGPAGWTSGTIVSVNGTVDIPAGQTVGALVVVQGTATIEGSADSIVLVSSTATLTGASARHLTVVDGTATLGPGTTVSDGVATLGGTVARDEGASVTGPTTSLDADVGALALALIPIAIVVVIGVYLAMIAAGLVVAALGARQVRAAGELISRRPGHVLAAGLVGTIALPILFTVLILTVIGAPIGIAMVLVGLPLLAFVGWLVAALWIGDWLLGRRGAREAEHPYRAAVVGVVVLAVAGLLPFVSAIATLFGVGAVLLAAWGSFRPGTHAPVGRDASTGADTGADPNPSGGWASPTPAAG